MLRCEKLFPADVGQGYCHFGSMLGASARNCHPGSMGYGAMDAAREPSHSEPHDDLARTYRDLESMMSSRRVF
jgi:hypothetical protein